jgi:hypothetical protein
MICPAIEEFVRSKAMSEPRGNRVTGSARHDPNGVGGRPFLGHLMLTYLHEDIGYFRATPNVFEQRVKFAGRRLLWEKVVPDGAIVVVALEKLLEAHQRPCRGGIIDITPSGNALLQPLESCHGKEFVLG